MDVSSAHGLTDPNIGYAPLASTFSHRNSVSTFVHLGGPVENVKTVWSVAIYIVYG